MFVTAVHWIVIPKTIIVRVDTADSCLSRLRKHLKRRLLHPRIGSVSFLHSASPRPGAKDRGSDGTSLRKSFSGGCGRAT